MRHPLECWGGRWRGKAGVVLADGVGMILAASWGDVLVPGERVWRGCGADGGRMAELAEDQRMNSIEDSRTLRS